MKDLAKATWSKQSSRTRFTVHISKWQGLITWRGREKMKIKDKMSSAITSYFSDLSCFGTEKMLHPLKPGYTVLDFQLNKSRLCLMTVLKSLFKQETKENKTFRVAITCQLITIYGNKVIIFSSLNIFWIPNDWLSLFSTHFSFRFGSGQPKLKRFILNGSSLSL